MQSLNKTKKNKKFRATISGALFIQLQQLSAQLFTKNFKNKTSMNRIN